MGYGEDTLILDLGLRRLLFSSSLLLNSSIALSLHCSVCLCLSVCRLSVSVYLQQGSPTAGDIILFSPPPQVF